jgi:hypothetical protein
MSIDWLDILKISVSSSVLAASFGWGLNHYFVHRAGLKRDARYLAQRLALILERYATDCAKFISDNDLHDRSGGSAGQRHLALPAMGAFPAEADWKALDPNLMDRVLSMENELVLADQKILFWWDVVGDEDSMQTEADHQAGQCGLKAWSLAGELRGFYRIPASTLPTTGWDFVATLRQQADAAEAARQRLLKED